MWSLLHVSVTSNHHQADISLHAWWWLLVTETWSKLHIIEYIVVFWLNDRFGFIQQHNGMAPIKKNILLMFQGYPQKPILLRKDANLLLHCTFSFRLNVHESNAETTNLELNATLGKENKSTISVVNFVGYLMIQLHWIRWEDQEHYVGKDLKQTAFAFNWINQSDTATSQVYYLSFKYSSTCFGHPHAHHQELQQLQ